MVAAVVLLCGATAGHTALACGSFEEAPVVKKRWRPDGERVRRADLIAMASQGGELRPAAADIARAILRARGLYDKLAYIDGEVAMPRLQMSLALGMLNALHADDPDDSRVASDLGEALSRSPHMADRIRGLNLLTQLDAQGTLTTAQGYAALARAWSGVGRLKRAREAAANCETLAEHHHQCAAYSISARPLQLAKQRANDATAES